MNKRYLFGVIESILGLVFTILVVLSYICVNSRLTVFVLGTISLLILVALIVMFYISLSRSWFPIGLTIALASLMFYAHVQYTISLWTLNLTLVISFVTLSLSVICVLIKYFQSERHIAKALKKSVGWIPLVLFFSFVATTFYNYSFDLTEPTSIEYEIVSKDPKTVGMIDQSTSIFAIRGTGYWYTIKCSEQSDLLQISDICISEDYHLEEGDHIYITYFQGLIFPIYQVDYYRIDNTEIK